MTTESRPVTTDAPPAISAIEARADQIRRTTGLWLGPLVFVLLLVFPPGLSSPEAARLTAVLAFTIVWWVTEAVPIPVTALIAPCLAVVLGIGTAAEMFAPFGDPIVFMFLGGFLIAEGMSHTGLDRRVAFGILARPSVAKSPLRILIAFTVLTAGISAWISNTATAAMIYPIGVSVLHAMARHKGMPFTSLRFSTALMLSVAWAASIGGIMTPVGTAPNLIAIGQLQKLTGQGVPFLHWVAVAAPIAIAIMVFMVMYFRFVLPPDVEAGEGVTSKVRAEQATFGAMTRAQKVVLLCFAVTVLMWVIPGVVAAVLGTTHPSAVKLQRHLPEAVAAVIGGCLLFLIPAERGRAKPVLGWEQAARIDWGTLMLFGGGLSLGGAMFRTGLASSFGDAMVAWTGSTSLVALTCLFCWVAILLTETTSNTAAATMLAPLAVAAAKAAGVSPVPVAMAVSLGASMAFMLPVSTPPNAIVYGSGAVRITAMIKHGLVLDLAAAVIIPIGVLFGCRLVGLA
jgi:sodium-dependent dicarboxylate transporter 2/3/5